MKKLLTIPLNLRGGILMEIAVTADNFETEVLKSKLPVLVDFWASWCKPCELISPHIKALAQDYKGKIKVCKINVDENSAIAISYTVMSIPALIIFKNGSVVAKKVGVMKKKDIEKFIAPHINETSPINRV